MARWFQRANIPAKHLPVTAGKRVSAARRMTNPPLSCDHRSCVLRRSAVERVRPCLSRSVGRGVYGGHASQPGASWDRRLSSAKLCIWECWGPINPATQMYDIRVTDPVRISSRRFSPDTAPYGKANARYASADFVPSFPPPAAMTTYCFPPTAKVLGVA